MRRGRFAPTPSGELHIGNARTALLAWLQMRKAGGTFVLRIEDIDQPRSRPEYARQMVEDLRWLGIDWDEGPDFGGPYAPYRQSERTQGYEDAILQLDRDRQLYPCYCSRKELRDIARASGNVVTRPFAYPGLCRHLTPEEQAEKSKKKDSLAPDDHAGSRDPFLGERSFPPEFGGDFIIKRADGIFSYQLAVVVDDAAMGITDILRGADLLDSTPHQLVLYEALRLPVPRFTHVPLVYGPDGQPLSKRHGSSVTLASLRAEGVHPEHVVGWLAYLSGLLQRPEPLPSTDLIPDFDLKNLPKEPIYLDPSQLQALTEEDSYKIIVKKINSHLYR